MKKIFVLCATVALGGCVAANIAQNQRLPTPAEAQAQLQADLAALKLAGCITAEASSVAAPIVAATVDANGQRIAQAVDASGTAVCNAPSPPVAPVQ